MSEEKKDIKIIRGQIQEGFITQKTPLIKRIPMTEDKRKGFVPPAPPRKPPVKPSKGK